MPDQDDKSKFGQLLDVTLAEGPQMATKGGVDAAMLIPIEQWRKLERIARLDLTDLLVPSEARTGDLVPPRRRPGRRTPTAIQGGLVASNKWGQELK